MRVVSLEPGATATLAAMGAADCLVGVTVHADLPPTDADGPPPETVGGWLNPDFEAVEALDPDLVLTGDALQAEVRDELRSRGLAVHHRAPTTLDDAVAGFADLGAAVGHAEAGRALRDRSRARLDAIAEAVVDRERATVYCEEWSDPPMAAGNWVPEAVRAAGGEYPFVDPGERSREVDPGTVETADPDHVVLHLCGHGDLVDPETFRERDWAVDAPVHVFDDSLLNQPSPALLDGVERLAEVLHGVEPVDPPG